MAKEPSYSFEDFKARAELGHKAEVRVAQLLRHWGYDVPDPVLHLRDPKDVDAIASFTKDQQDLSVAGLYLEVKSRQTAFTSQADYPYSFVTLDTVSGWKAKRVKPELYIIVSRTTGAIMAVDARDSSIFVERMMEDRARGTKEPWYVVPKKYLRPHTWLEGFLAALSTPKAS